MTHLNDRKAALLIRLGRAIFGDRVALPHLMAFAKYNTVKKMINMARTVWEKKLGRTEVKSKPFIMFLEVNNICNLHCPFCLTGKGKSADRPLRNMTLDEMKKSIEDLSDHLYFLQLYNWGEPLLNPDLFDFIKYARQRGVFTMVSSNMNFTRSSTAEQVVGSGLDYFIAAIDGFSPQTYEQYRRGGKFQKTIDNLKAILDIRKKMASPYPFVEWQYVVFKHNQHELESAREYANNIGVDYFHPIKGYIEDETWITTLPEFQTEIGHPESVAHCARPWTHFNVRADGGVASCCYVFYKKDDFDNIFEHPFTKVWNNDHFRAARHILAKGLKHSWPEPNTVCHQCLAAGLRPSFEQAEESEAATPAPVGSPLS